MVSNRFLVGMLAFFLSSVAMADEADGLWELTTEGSTTNLMAGDRGLLVINIKAKSGAHVSDEAPLRIELSSKDSKLEKQKLTLADSVTKKNGSAYPDPRFEVGFTPNSKGTTTLDGKLTFFICTEKLCMRQTKNLALKVDVK
jgi:hypothetical protein